MATNPERFPYERRVDELVRAYRDAQRTLSAQVRADLLEAEQLGMFARRRFTAYRLRALLEFLEQLGAETDPKAAQLVREALYQSSDRTLALQIGIGINTPTPGTFAGVAREAVEQIQAATLTRLDAARDTVGRRVEDVFARAGRRGVLLGLLGADGSRRTASSRMVAELRQQGTRAFVDRAGRQWALDTYAEMAVRTTTREAVVQGSLIRMAAHGVNLARVSVHAEPCPVCAPWQGRLVSLDGRTAAFQGEPVATLGALPGGGPPMHPRCRHTLSPVAARVEQLRRELAGAF